MRIAGCFGFRVTLARRCVCVCFCAFLLRSLVVAGGASAFLFIILLIPSSWVMHMDGLFGNKIVVESGNLATLDSDRISGQERTTNADE